jgi:hypothetical protein
VSFVVRVRAPSKRTEGSRYAVNLGWRITNQGLRIGTVLCEGQDEAENIYLPRHLIAAAGRSATYRSRSDDGVNAMAIWLSTMPRDDAPPALHEAISGVLARRVARPGHLVEGVLRSNLEIFDVPSVLRVERVRRASVVGLSRIWLSLGVLPGPDHGNSRLAGHRRTLAEHHLRESQSRPATQ